MTQRKVQLRDAGHGALTELVAADIPDLSAVYDTAGAAAAVPTLALSASNALFSTGTVVLSGQGAAVVNTAAGSIRISVPVQTVQTQNMVAISASDALFSSGTVVMSGFGAATVNTAAGTIRISVPTQTVQTQNLVALSASDNLYSSGTLVLSGFGAVTVNTSNQTVRISAPVQSVQTQNLVAISASDAMFSSGTVVLTGAGGGVTVNTAAGSIRVSVAAPVAQTVQTQNLVVLAASNASFSSGTVVLTGTGGGITVNTSAGTIGLSVAAPVAQTNQAMTFYALSQTTGGASSTTFDARTISINAYGGLSVGFSAGSIQLSGGAGAAQSVQTQSLIAGVYDGANSISTGTIRFTNANGVSFSINGQTLSGSVAAGATATGNLGGIAGSNSTYTSGTVVLSGANGISIGTAGQQINISAEGMLSSYFANSAGLFSGGSTSIAVASASVVRVQLPHAITFTRVDFPVSVQTASAGNSNTAAIAISSVGVLYSLSGSTLNPIVGASGTITVSWASNSATVAIKGARLVSFPLATTLSAGDYWLGFHLSTTSGISHTAAANTTALNATVSVLLGGIADAFTNANFADFGAASLQTANPMFPLNGLISSALTLTGQTLQQNQITNAGASIVRAALPVLFRNNA